MSLRDKLKMVASAPEQPPLDAGACLCEVREIVYPLDVVPAVSQDALRLMSGTDTPLSLERMAFLDTETTGLSGGAGTLAFLVGIGRVEGNAFVVRQYLMRDYPQEADMLERVLEALADTDCFVTYNGKSFDAPLLRSRMIMKRLRLPEYTHIDLLHIARAVWKARMPDMKLKTLEEYLLGMERHDDIPGAEIPAVWFDAVKTGDFTRVEDVLRHNAQDIRTLLDLLERLSGALAEPERQDHPADLFSLGRLFERKRDISRAKVLYRMAIPTYLGAGARVRLSIILKREGDYATAEGLLMRLAASGQHRLFARIELAKLYEHRLGRLGDALRETEAALTLQINEDVRNALFKRRDRLLRKLGMGELR